MAKAGDPVETGVRGRIAYRDAQGRETGREWFSISTHRDGSRTLRAQCEMDDRALIRDALLALDAEGRAREAFVRVVENGRRSGSRWYDFAEPVRFFGTHSLINDGWLALLGDGLAAGETRALTGLLTCSIQADGGGAPGLIETEAALTFEGESEGVGRWSVRYGDFPPLTMRVQRADALLLSMDWPHLGASYELVELTAHTGASAGS